MSSPAESRSQTDFGECLVVKTRPGNNNFNLLLKFYWGKNPSLPRLSCGYRDKFPAAPVKSAPMLMSQSKCSANLQLWCSMVSAEQSAKLPSRLVHSTAPVDSISAPPTVII